MNLKKKAIFAYLVELQRIPEMIKRYLPIVADEFIYRFKDRINSNDFNGEVSQFHEFESVIDQYFIM